MKKLTLLVAFLIVRSALFAQQIWYVKSDAPGLNTGLSWEDAFTDLQSAVFVAHAGDDIWVAAGTYKPTQSDNRDASFQLPTGVRLAGGFSGMETMFGQRNWTEHVTTLSGDIGVAEISTDNSYHVVTIHGGDTLTILDGFRIVHGRANQNVTLSPLPFGGGVVVSTSTDKPASTPIIQNCTFQYNYAISGGGIGCYGALNEHAASPWIKNCRFLNNRASQGGGVYKGRNCLPNRSFRLENCEFKGNYSTYSGGGLDIRDANGQSEIIRCSFVSDTAFILGGAIFMRSTVNVEYIIDSCTFTGNYSSEGGGVFQDHLAEDAVLRIRNCDFDFNESPAGLGGAVRSSCTGYQTSPSIFLDNNRFKNNTGRGVFINNGSFKHLTVKIDRCLFYENTVGPFLIGQERGGGVYIYTITTSFLPQFIESTVSNSVFAHNDGAIAVNNIDAEVIPISRQKHETNVINCSFLNNRARPFIKFQFPELDTTMSYERMNIFNSIIWEEEAIELFSNNNFGTSQVNNILDFQVEHSLIVLPDCEYAGFDPCGTGMLYETAPQFVSTDPAMPELSLLAGSPAVNRGSNIVADTFGLQYDYSGRPRILQDTVDMGAFESDSIVSGIQEPGLVKEAFLMQVQPNVLFAGTSLQVMLLNLTGAKDFTCELYSPDGMLQHRLTSKNMSSQVPVKQVIPTDNLAPGLYFLSVSNNQGARKTHKIVVKR